jgi:hypothetical protein
MQRFLRYLVIICLVLAGISPACQFISGQSLMEICGADGNVKTAPIPEELAAYQPGADEQPPTDETHRDMPDCAFCFAQTHFSSLQASYAVVLPVDLADAPHSIFNAHIVAQASFTYEARGPPSFS